MGIESATKRCSSLCESVRLLGCFDGESYLLGFGHIRHLLTSKLATSFERILKRSHLRWHDAHLLKGLLVLTLGAVSTGNSAQRQTGDSTHTNTMSTEFTAFSGYRSANDG